MDNNKDRIKKAEQIYQRHAADLEAKFRNMIVAIHIESEKHFVGRDELEAYDKGVSELPDARFVFLRIGAPYVHYVG
jgi:hypothetical protein